VIDIVSPIGNKVIRIVVVVIHVVVVIDIVSPIGDVDVVLISDIEVVLQVVSSCVVEDVEYGIAHGSDFDSSKVDLAAYWTVLSTGETPLLSTCEVKCVRKERRVGRVGVPRVEDVLGGIDRHEAYGALGRNRRADRSSIGRGGGEDREEGGRKRTVGRECRGRLRKNRRRGRRERLRWLLRCMKSSRRRAKHATYPRHVSMKMPFLFVLRMCCSCVCVRANE